MFEGYSTRELAIYFTKGSLGSINPRVTTKDLENKRIIVRDYLSTRSPKFQREFQKHLEDTLLGELDEDN